MATLGDEHHRVLQRQGWVVIVVRAWRERDGLRIRLLRSGAEDDEGGVVVASAEDAARVLTAWLGDLGGRRGDDGNDDAG